MGSILTSLPDCAAKCLLSVFDLACDATCRCQNEELKAKATACIMEACSIREQLTSKKLTNDACGIVPERDNWWIIVQITFASLATVVVALRLVARWLGSTLWWDDWCNFGSLIICIIYTARGVAYSDHGLGWDTWDVPLDQVSNVLELVYIASVLFTIGRMLTRTSIILFYVRIFQVPTAKRVMRWAMAVNAALSVPAIIVTTFMCTPLSYTWTRWDGTTEGSCINIKAFLWTIWIMLIVNDFVAIGVPLPFIYKLQLSRTKKALISFMFCTGFCVVALNIYKLIFINQFSGGHNPTADVIPMGTWAVVEMDVGVICACMPSLPIIYRSISSRLKNGSNINQSTSYHSSNQGIGTISGAGGNRNLSSNNNGLFSKLQRSGKYNSTQLSAGTMIRLNSVRSESETTLHIGNSPSDAEDSIPNTLRN